MFSHLKSSDLTYWTVTFSERNYFLLFYSQNSQQKFLLKSTCSSPCVPLISICQFPVAEEGVSVHPDVQDRGGIGTHCCVTVPALSCSRESVHVRRAAAAVCFWSERIQISSLHFLQSLSNSILCEEEEGGLVGEMVGRTSKVVSGNLGNVPQQQSEEEALRWQQVGNTVFQKGKSQKRPENHQ